MAHLFYLLVFPFFLVQMVFAGEISEGGSVRRPQEPTLPYPYQEEEVVFANSGAGITLAGTLTLPPGKGPFPVVVLLHGSAPLDRNSSLFGHRPFLVWADYLTTRGIAVLRYDKRSAGKSTGDYSLSSLQDFAADALVAVDYLKTRKEINSRQIGLVGHSEGGMTATLAASKSTDIAFVVMMAAPCVNAEELVCLQEMLLQRVDGVDETMIRQGRRVREKVFAIMKEEKNRDIAAGQMRGVLDAYLGRLTPSQRKVAESCYGPTEEQIKMFNSTSFRYWLTYDPAIVLKQLEIPVLALNGELDFVVSAEQNLTRISSTLKEVGHKDYTAIQLPKINHGFATCKTGSIAEYVTIEETAAPSVLELITGWILDRTVKKK